MSALAQPLRNIYLNHHHTYLLKENLRFELAFGEEMDYFPRVERAKIRAHCLFQEIFKNTDTIQLILVLYDKAFPSHISKYLHRNSFKIIDSFSSDAWSDEDELNPVTLLVIETEQSNLRLNKLIDGICYQDFFNYGKLKIKNPIIFYHKKDNVILNIYDDRGCDIWSDNFSYQKNLYHTYYSWLLDYDLNNMTKFYQDKL